MTDYDGVIREIQKILREGSVKGMPLTKTDRDSLNQSIKLLKRDRTMKAPEPQAQPDV